MNPNLNSLTSYINNCIGDRRAVYHGKAAVRLLGMSRFHVFSSTGLIGTMHMRPGTFGVEL